ncbi:TonB-dependent receptor [Saprospira sp. CCB-QB6]|uniref:TonB-dependent receptor n=1 Tax=Saprospira sp. CCB-QB6 TaxID=3023936 RepID=UPI00234975C7|nr:TonB-dependent receptor [Saprospira sp. CCB-QB6]WCL80705.1 TonB-dependent receptor [Saprospira sp. CCB-QB6]
MRQFLETEQKALEINLDPRIYGSFAEIGAGQEVARYFFKVGAAAGTIAKTISAYDKVVSDDIYGREPSGRYVCESRLYRMLDHEYELLLDRLSGQRPDLCLFAFADTITTINYHRTIKGQGWMGMRFQLSPHAEPNEIVLHIELEDGNANLQQQAVGILGVNLLYACYRYHADYKELLASLLDKLEDRIRIDVVRMKGPDFEHIDNRLLLLSLIEQNLTDVAVFDKKGQPVHISEFLYKKNLLLVRGNYNPTTLLSLDMIRASAAQFRADFSQRAMDCFIMTEMTLDSLQGEENTTDEKNFLERAKLLNHLGQYVMITDCDRYHKLIRYAFDYRIQHLGLVLENNLLLSLLSGKYERNKDGRLLTAFGEVFTRNVTLYAYPELKEGSGELLQTHNLPIPEGMRNLYQHLLDQRQIRDVEGYNEEILHIRSTEALRKIQAAEEGWEKMLSDRVARYIQERGAFGFPLESMEFDY